MNDATVIRMFGEIGQKLRNPKAIIAMLIEFPRRLHELGLAIAASSRRGVFTAVCPEFRLVIKEVYVRWSTLHAEENDMPSAGRKMGLFDDQWRTGTQDALLCQGGKSQVTKSLISLTTNSVDVEYDDFSIKGVAQ